MNEITRCIHEAEDHAKACWPGSVRRAPSVTARRYDLLVIAFLEERLAMLDVIDKRGDLYIETRRGLETEIAGRKLKLEQR